MKLKTYLLLDDSSDEFLGWNETPEKVNPMRFEVQRWADGRCKYLGAVVCAPSEPLAILTAFKKFNITQNDEQSKIRCVPTKRCKTCKRFVSIVWDKVKQKYVLFFHGPCQQ